MSTIMGFLIFATLLPCIVSLECFTNADIADRHFEAEATELGVELLQHSMSVTQSSFNSQDKAVRMDQIQTELDKAKQLHQHWANRVDALENLLRAATEARQHRNNASDEVSTSTPDPTLQTDPVLYERYGWNAKMVCLSIGFACVSLYAVWNIWRYEATRDEMAEPWYHNSKCLSRVIAALGGLWLIVGMVAFTEFFWFTDQRRHLTLIETLYLSAQIVTTVGYGDLTPTSDRAKIFVAIYAFTGVAMIATLVQQLIFMFMESEERKSVAGHLSFMERYRKTLNNIASVSFCLLCGTLFYSCYPPEDMSVFEALYMSIITLLTIGFGAYHPRTQIGRLFGSIWMMVGVVCMGQAVVAFTDAMFQHRQSIRSARAAKDLFDDIDKKHTGTIDRAQFLTFELIRAGVPKAVLDLANAKFETFDADHSGALDKKEFHEYVNSADDFTEAKS